MNNAVFRKTMENIKALLAIGSSTFFINEKSIFSNEPRSLPRNPPVCTILDNWVFDNLVSADKQFAKALRKFAASPLVNNNMYVEN